MPVDDAFTKALIHFYGTDASTTFKDESGKTWTARGNAQLDTAQSKFNSASGLFDGTGDWIDTPDSADFDVGSGDWTVDFWLRFNSLAAATQRFCGQSDATGTIGSRCVETACTGTPIKLNGLMAWGSGGSDFTPITGTTTLVTGQWYHVALVRDGNTLRMFLDGVSEGTASVAGKTANNSTNLMSVGRLGEFASNNLNGWIDEFRFTKGVARWTSNFTPPTAEYAHLMSGVLTPSGTITAAISLTISAAVTLYGELTKLVSTFHILLRGVVNGRRLSGNTQARGTASGGVSPIKLRANPLNRRLNAENERTNG